MNISEDLIRHISTYVPQTYYLEGHSNEDFNDMYNKVKNGATWEDLEMEFYQ